MRRELKCEECGKLFLSPKGHHKTCSPDCSLARKKRIACQRTKSWIENNAERRRAYQLSRHQPMKFFACKNCEKTFVKRNSKLFCSIACRGKYRRKTKPDWYKNAHTRRKQYYNSQSLARYYRARENAPWQIMVEVAEVRARKKKIPYDLTVDWAKNRWTGRCEATGIPFILGNKIRGPFSPSLDQITAGAGYTQNNCRFVIWAFNAAKGVGTDADMLQLAKAIVAHQEPTDAATWLSLPG